MAVRAEPVYPVPWYRGRFASWITTVDHKRIGILYLITCLVFFGAGGILAVLMRTQLAHTNEKFLSAEHYNEVMREAADVHRDLFAEFADSYGDNVRTKIERCLTVTDGEYESAVRAREEIAEGAEQAVAGLDLVLTPTLGSVAAKLPVDDLEIRADTIRLTIPFNSLGWPALALPCGPAEDWLPASLQIAGRPGSDALVLAAGKLVESLLPG